MELLDAKGFKAVKLGSGLLVLDDYWMLMDVVFLWQAKYDFVYLPIDFQNKVNLG